MPEFNYPYAEWVLVGITVLAFMLLVGWWFSKRIKRASDFIVAGRFNLKIEALN